MEDKWIQEITEIYTNMIIHENRIKKLENLVEELQCSIRTLNNQIDYIEENASSN